MSQAQAVAAPPLSPDSFFLEQRIFQASPFGTFVSSVLIFLFLVGSYLALSAITGFALLTPRVGALAQGTWPAFVLSLLITVALGMQRYARLRDLADAPALDAALRHRRQYLERLCNGEAVRRLRLAGAIGALVGFVGSFGVTTPGLYRSEPGMFVWFCVTTMFVCFLFARGVEKSIRGGESFTQAIDRDLVIDLLRIDSLAAIGRSGARSALIWFSVAAVILLFFVSERIEPLTIGGLLLAAAMGIWIFVQPMERIRRRIAAAKHAELDHIRNEIAQVRAALGSDPHASAKLQGLLAYEHRIEAVREWPFDQSTLVRVGASALILTVPWFGQAVTQYFVDSIARVPG
jgi:hypothetical protein